MWEWNFADVWEAVAGADPSGPCQRQGQRMMAWGEFDARANGLAADLLAAGLRHQAKVAAFLYNGPEFLETYLAAWKAGLVPVNTNYRYGADEVAYLLGNADAEAVVFHAELAPVLLEARPRLPRVRRWYVVGGPVEWAVPYEEAAAAGGPDPVRGPWGRSGDDLLLLYTGGTTGRPKGVMWRQDDLGHMLGAGGNPVFGLPPADSLEEVGTRRSFQGLSLLPACPLVHGTGQFTAFVALDGGGCVVTLPGRHFDAEELWDTVARARVNAVSIVGDAFARPMLQALERHPGRWDLSSLALIVSSGVMWSRETKDGLMAAIPQVVLWDELASSEALGLAEATATGGKAQETASFRVGERVQVLTDSGEPVRPGSEEIGLVGISGRIPLGYYGDPEATARSFRTVDGVRYAVPGDYARVRTDGSLVLLGRGSQVINTGGEKVFPEEVEEILKTHPAVADAACVGVPDERFGETVCAVVQAVGPVDEASLIALVKGRLAAYKAPRRVLVVPTIGRSPAGKLDYPALTVLARQRIGRG